MSQPATATNFPDALEHECVELVVDASGIVQELKGPASALRIAGLLATKARFLDQVHPDERDFVGTNMSWALTSWSRKAQISFRLARPDGRWSNVKAHIHKRDADAVEISLQSDNEYARPSKFYCQQIARHSRRMDNGAQVRRVTQLALGRGPSVDFAGYYQRHVKAA